MLGSDSTDALTRLRSHYWLVRRGSRKLIHVSMQVVLECKGETQIRNLSAKLSEAGVPHKMWVEQPEDYPTALATKPCRKSTVANYFNKLKLCKGTLA